MKIFNKKAVSVIEYTVLFIIIIGAFLIMRTYIQRGIYGNWAQSGQSFAFGRQYDAQKTTDCAFDQVSGNWYDYNCYEYYVKAGYCPTGACTGGVCSDGSACGACNGGVTCEEGIINGKSCSASYCTQLNNGASL